MGPPDDGARDLAVCVCRGPRVAVVARPPQVVLHVPLATALGVSEAPGELEGHGPLSAAQTRQLLVGAEITALFVDGATGQPVNAAPRPLHRPKPGDGLLGADRLRDLLREVSLSTVELPAEVVEPQHDPSAGLARYVRLRDRGCDGIGCSVPAAQCELDHHTPWPEGKTTAGNLKARSKRCHHAKHAGWTVTAHEGGGSSWTSPGGRSYHTPGRWHPPPQLPPDARLPSPEGLASQDRALLTPVDDPGL